MKKIICLFFAATLLSIGASPKISLAEPVSNQQPEQGLGETFAALALDKFSSDNPGQDTSLLASRVQGYGREAAKILLEGKMEPQTAESIIREFAPWYAETLDNILNGDNALNFYINEYIRQITDLFSRHKLGLSVQSQLVLLTSSHLEKMRSLLKPSFYHYQ